MDRWTAATAACEICVSKAVRDHQQSATGLPSAFFSVIENGIPLERFLDIERMIERDALTVVSVGRLDPQKNYSFLLEAWRTVQQKFPNAVLKIAGRGAEEAHLKSLAAQSSLRVEFLGFVEDIPALLCGCDVYVQTSEWEGFGLAVAEAMAAEMPVVVTDVDSLPDLVHHERTGLVVPRKDSAALVDALELLLSDVALRKKLGAAARADARVRFDARRMVMEHAALYERIVKLKGS
jgi:glycosyltransferase involved in cell wall biosynthesis